MSEPTEKDIANLRKQFPGKQITILYDKAFDATTIRIDPGGLKSEIYYQAAKEDEYKGILAAIERQK